MMFLTPLFQIPSSTVTDLTANVTGQLGDVGTLTLVVGVASIGLIFYVIKKIIALVPKK